MKAKKTALLPYKYKPDRWVVIKLTPTDGTPHHYRVFGSWGGSYIHGQSWQMNSGITSVKEHKDHYYFSGSSGSVYCCPKRSYGYFSYGLSVLSNIIEESKDDVSIVEMPEDTNWLELNYDPKNS